MQKLSNIAHHVTLLTALSHILCCGLPVLASILSLSTVAGSMIGLSAWHDVMHDYEIIMLAFSAGMIAVSFLLLWIARKRDCRVEAGCEHEPCAPKKDRSAMILIAATLLFTINLAIYMLADHH